MADPKSKVDPADYGDVDIDDVDNPEWTERDFAAARPFLEVFPEFVAEPNSEQVVLSVSPATIAAFAEDGEDWKERMAAALDQAARARRAA